MRLRNERRANLLWVGVSFAATGLIASTLNATAVPVILDLPLLALAMSGLGVLFLSPAFWQELKQPEPTTFRLVLATFALLGSFRIVTLSLEQSLLAYRATEVHFRSDGIELAGTIYAPRSSGPHPAIVMVHGSGPETRKEYAFFARLFARQGFVGLVYDKRGSGASTGNLSASDYQDYARDALAAVRFLEQRREVRPGCIGLLGFSEGEWVAPLAAIRSSAVAFLIVVAPSGVSPAQQVNQEIALRLRAHGFPEQIVRRALALNDPLFEYQRTGRGAAELRSELHEARKESWFEQAQDIPAELYPPGDYAWWRSVMDFDPMPIWERVKVPVLLLKGAKDTKSDAGLARAQIESALVRGRNDQFQFIIFPEGDHSLLDWPLGSHVPPPIFTKDYLDALKRWTRERACVDL